MRFEPPPLGGLRRRRFGCRGAAAHAQRFGRWFALLVVCTGASLPLSSAAAPLRVALIAGAEPDEREATASLGSLRATLEQQAETTVAMVVSPPGSGTMPALAALATADVAVLYGGSGQLSAADAALLREFLARGKGLVVLRETTAGWTAWPDFVPAVLGAKRTGLFAGGAPMAVINLFGHAIFTGVARIETAQAMPQYEELAADAMLVIEGTAGEATAPLGWLRRSATGRVAHLVPAEPALFRQPEYRQLLANTVSWVARRPIPGARPLVQRTYLPDAYPGAIAITFPEGPTACFDPTRGGISQVADADFVDLRPRWITKQGQPARVAGELFFHDAGRSSFWAGGGATEPRFQFKGYRLEDDVLELHYRVGDRDVRERIRPARDGRKGVRREFHVGPGAQPLLFRQESQARADVTTRGMAVESGGLVYRSTEPGVVTMDITASIRAAQ